MTPVQFLTFRELLESSSGFQSGQFRELEAILGRRDRGVLTAYHEGSVDYEKVEAALARPSVYDSFFRYLAGKGYEIPVETLERDVTQPVEESAGVQAAVLQAYRDDGEPAQVAERLVDFDEGFMEWRYHHVKMVERTIGSKMAPAATARSTSARRSTSRSSPTSGRSAASFDRGARRALLGLSRLRAAVPDGAFAPGVAGCSPRGTAGGVAGRGRARRPQVGARVREGGAGARRRTAAARRPGRAGCARGRTRTSSCSGSCRRCRCERGRSSSRPTASSTPCDASSAGWPRRALEVVRLPARPVETLA